MVLPVGGLFKQSNKAIYYPIGTCRTRQISQPIDCRGGEGRGRNGRARMVTDKLQTKKQVNSRPYINM